MEKPTIFISHSVTDSEWVRSFAQALKQHGLIVCFDNFDDTPDEASASALEKWLRTSDVHVALLDRDSSRRPNVAFELGAAIGLGKKIVPIVPKDIDQGYSFGSAKAPVLDP